MTAIDAVLEEIRESPNLPSYVNELTVPPPKLKIAFATRHITPEGVDKDSHADCVADWFNVRPELVLAAVRFELGPAA